MEKIIVKVAWCDTNFGAAFSENVPGAAVFTAPTFAALQREAPQTLAFHIEGVEQDGTPLPEWLKHGDYAFEYRFRDAQTLLRAYAPFVTLAAVSRASGINPGLLSQYANGTKKPRQLQQQRILDAFHTIGHELAAATF